MSDPRDTPNLACELLLAMLGLDPESDCNCKNCEALATIASSTNETVSSFGGGYRIYSAGVEAIEGGPPISIVVVIDPTDPRSPKPRIP